MRHRGRRSDGRADTVIVLENDLYRRADDAAVERTARTRRGTSSSSITSSTPPRPSAEVAAAGRHLRRGRRHAGEQRRARAALFSGLRARTGEIQESWRWLRDLMLAAGRRRSGLADARRRSPPRWSRRCPASRRSVTSRRRPASAIAGQKIPREPHRYSGRTAIAANVTRPRAAAARRSRLAARLHDGRLPGPAAARAHPSLLVAGLELGAGGQQVPERGRWPAARRRSRPAPDRAARRERRLRIPRRCPPPFEPRADEWLLCAALPHFRLRGTECAHAGHRRARLPGRTWRCNPDDAGAPQAGRRTARVELALGERSRAACRVQLLPDPAARIRRPARRAAAACVASRCRPGASIRRAVRRRN